MGTNKERESTLTSTTIWEGTIPTALENVCRSRSERTAFVLEDGEEVSFSSLHSRVKVLAAQVSGVLGIGPVAGLPGPRIAIILPNGFPLSLSLLAAMHVGIACPMNPNLKEFEILDYLPRIEPSLLITDGVNPMAIEIAIKLGIPVTHITRDGVLLGAESAEKFPLYGSRQHALYLPTSGTTGRPKIVPLSHRNLLTSTEAVVTNLGLSEDDVCLSMWNQFHIGGVVDLLLAPLLAGGSVISTPGFEREEFFHQLASRKPTWAQFVPTTLREVVKSGRLQPGICHHLRFVRCVAASLDNATREQTREVFGVPVVETYGMTEASPLITSTSTSREEQYAPGSLGHPVKSVELRVIAPSDGESGEIEIRGPAVFDGYLHENKRVDTQGWFRTGDLGRLGPSGDLFIEGRTKELINRGGEKVNPYEVELALSDAPFVEEACAFAAPHKSLGESVALAVIRTPGMPSTEDDVRNWLSERLASFKIPSQIFFVSDLPRTPNGKVIRNNLKDFELSLENSTNKYAPRQRTKVEEVLCQIWSAELELVEVGVDDDFVMLGGDSLSSLRIGLTVEKVFGVDFTDSELLGLTTVAKMAQYLENHKAAVPKESPPDYGKKGIMEAKENSLGPDFYRDKLRGGKGIRPRRIREQALIHLVSSELKECLATSKLMPWSQLSSRTTDPKYWHWRRKLLAELSSENFVDSWGRRPVFDFGTLYFAGETSQAKKTLVLSFTGSALRMMMPTHSFLARTGLQNFDFLFLFDPNTTHYQEGIPGIGDNIYELSATLSFFIREQGYARIQTLGASAGGLAALAVGLEIEAEMISMAAPDRLDFHPQMSEILRRMSESRTRESLIRVVSSARPRDTTAVELVRELFPEVDVRVDFRSRDHNILRTTWNKEPKLFPELMSWLVGSNRDFRF